MSELIPIEDWLRDLRETLIGEHFLSLDETEDGEEFFVSDAGFGRIKDDLSQSGDFSGEDADDIEDSGAGGGGGGSGYDDDYDGGDGYSWGKYGWNGIPPGNAKERADFAEKIKSLSRAKEEAADESGYEPVDSKTQQPSVAKKQESPQTEKEKIRQQVDDSKRRLYAAQVQYDPTGVKQTIQSAVSNQTTRVLPNQERKQQVKPTGFEQAPQDKVVQVTGDGFRFNGTIEQAKIMIAEYNDMYDDLNSQIIDELNQPEPDQALINKLGQEASLVESCSRAIQEAAGKAESESMPAEDEDEPAAPEEPEQVSDFGETDDGTNEDDTEAPQTETIREEDQKEAVQDDEWTPPQDYGVTFINGRIIQTPGAALYDQRTVDLR